MHRIPNKNSLGANTTELIEASQLTEPQPMAGSSMLKRMSLQCLKNTRPG